MARDAYRQLILHGAVVFLLANVSGWILLLVRVRNPRMMLSTHVAALFGALLMMAIGLLGPQLQLAEKAKRALVWSTVVSQYSFVITGLYAAVAGTSSMFAGPPGLRGTAVSEMLAQAGNGIGVVGSTVGAALLLWGLARARRQE